MTSRAEVVAARSVLHLCPRCGHLFTHVDLDLDRYYAATYDATLTDGGPDEVATTAAGELAFRTDIDYRIFRELTGAAVHPGASVLEYGCGRGRILSRLLRDGVRDLHACDLSESYRAPVEAIVGPGRVSIGARPAVSGADVACSFFVLEHDGDPRGALAYLRGALRPDGRLFLMVPSYMTNLGDLACADHLSHFSGRSLAAFVARCGFDVLAVDDRSAVGAVALVARPSVSSEPEAGGAADVRVEAAQAGADLVAFLDRLRSVVACLDRGRPVYLYGAGFYASLAAAYLEDAGLTPAGLFDANPRKQGTVRLGLRIAGPEDAEAERHGDDVLLVCVNARVADAIAQRFRSTFAEVLVP